MLERLISHRRALHRIPEIMFDLPRTQAYLLKQLEALPFVTERVASSGVLAFFDAGKDDTVAFRSDMDALNLQELSGVDFASEIPGRMHACGHDGHMAMLLALAEELAAHPERLRRNVLLIFQPAEENGGGGSVIAASGALARYRVSRIFALHVEPSLPVGTLASRPGPMMAKSSEVHVFIRGRAAHVARYREGADALMAGAAFLLRAAEAEQSLARDIPRLLKFGVLQSGSAQNILSDHTEIHGTLRAFDQDTFSHLKNALYEQARTLETEYGVHFQINVDEGYPALINDPVLFEQAKQALSGMPFVTLAEPSMLAEDFSFYLERVPGLMIRLGVGVDTPLHAQTFNFDERALVPGVQALIRLSTL